VNDTRRRLIQCFTAVFSGLTEKDAAAASVDVLPQWDSIAMVTLLSVIEEEFGVAVPPSQMQQLQSFDEFHRYLETRQIAA
jgi:acyl carrier protein